MDLFIDTEFNGPHDELISMALVSTDLQTFYKAKEIVNHVDWWIKKNVIKRLNIVPVNNNDFKESLINFISIFDNPTIIYDSIEDIRYLERELGDCGISFNTLKISRKEIRRNKGKLFESMIPHNALEDALANRLTYLSYNK